MQTRIVAVIPSCETLLVASHVALGMPAFNPALLVPFRSMLRRLIRVPFYHAKRCGVVQSSFWQTGMQSCRLSVRLPIMRACYPRGVLSCHTQLTISNGATLRLACYHADFSPTFHLATVAFGRCSMLRPSCAFILSCTSLLGSEAASWNIHQAAAS